MRETIIDKFIAAARDCVGAPFRLQGRDPAYGLDCIGVITWSARQAGISVADAHDYLLTEDPRRLEAALEASPFDRVVGIPQAPGDILRFRVQGLPVHLGIFTGTALIHADLRLRKVVEHRLSADWLARLVDLWRYEETSWQH